MIIKKPNTKYDVVVVGAGPAGLAAAYGARIAGAERVLMIDREPEPGGILQQCIHTGFGLHTFGEELTGPEFAERFFLQAINEGSDLLLDSYVLGGDPKKKELFVVGKSFGSTSVEYGAMVMTMGCRERTRGALQIAGTRPAGIYTAGLAQKLVNMMGVLPGRRAVILGSGDIGLIMARRLVLEGCNVQGVFEILPYSSGLNRNIVQCLDDFDIPLHLSRTVTNIGGKDRLEWVEIGAVNDHLQPMEEIKKIRIPCDTLLLSVGLIPENELSQRLQVDLDPITSGPVVNSSFMTNVPGVFACGNVLHVHDLVDWVAEESQIAGQFAGAFSCGDDHRSDSVRMEQGPLVRYVVPHSICLNSNHVLRFRITRPVGKARIVLSYGDNEVHGKRIRYGFPAEMMELKLTDRIMEKIRSSGAETLKLSVTER